MDSCGHDDHTELLDTHDLARLLKLQHQTLRKWRSQGGGPAFIRLGGRVRYRRASIERWLAEKTVQSSSATTA